MEMLSVLIYHLARAQTRKAIRWFVHSGCTNSGLRPLRAMFPKGVCLPQNPRALSPARDCLGFVIADYIRVLFALSGSLVIYLRPRLSQVFVREDDRRPSPVARW